MIVTRQVMLPLRSGFQGVARCGPVYALIHGMTPDGSVIVGRISDADDQLQAFRWSEATGMVGLGVWQAGGHGLLTDDGSTLAFSGNPNHPAMHRWTEATGFVAIEGLGGPAEVGALSADGSLIHGYVGEGRGRSPPSTACSVSAANTEAWTWGTLTTRSPMSPSG